MAASVGTTVAMLNHGCFTIKSSKDTNFYKPTMKPISRLLSLKDIPKSFISFKTPINSITSIPGTILSVLIFCDHASGAQQVAGAAEGDKRVLALLLPIIPAILWVLYNILGPALNQINRMRSEKKGIIVGLGLGGLAGSTFFLVPNASASEVAMISEGSSDRLDLLLWFLVTPALLWILNNLQPAANQAKRTTGRVEMPCLCVLLVISFHFLSI